MKNLFKPKTIAVIAMIAAAATGCKKDYAADVNSPAYKITASEALVIPEAVDLPANTPGGNTRIATYYAVGVQQYKSQKKAGSNPVSFEWVFVGPKAGLFDVKNKRVGSHGAGPFWELSPADSIFAQHFSPAKTAAAPGGNSIDWLLLMPKNGKTPTGIFKDVTYVQRIATTEGKMPDTKPSAENIVAEVPYTAIYRFTRKN